MKTYFYIVYMFSINKFIVIIVVLTSNYLWGQETEKVQIVYSFENNTKLYSLPTVKSRVVKEVKVGTKFKVIEIIKLRDNNNFDNNWYSILFNNNIVGHVQENKLSLKYAVLDGSLYLTKESNGKLIIKLLESGRLLTSSEFDLKHFRFSFKVFGNKGLYGVKNVIMIDYIGLMTGENGGATYIFNCDSKLIKVMDLYWVGFPEEFINSEWFIFPDEQGKIIYVKEEKEKEAAASEWTKVKTIKQELEWVNNKLITSN